ncbi:cellulose biosynthesis protein BcsQ [Undibacterium sp. RTI2.1]|uniref:cellulose biosynthesis protein BcsQ n=1 Tax=unclassified Undibacterium TaxID=2630295 RepID=UPI002AB4D933|nr:MULTISPECIES: cellulose biosynthesis protein BcsQ [unclassified Undibacterium]MDY7538502.1 cellulose biosynthesis protein BcsQ [Undibacterium sp. 5I1]MEB0031951.1 cellulose biosynthesis protein BcsQ [Undibacterium sp. RTI2.1]MEB0114873.1 cellulose biosynthesis protein BcsQ [Undibacterium sp. RTI2.2]MEB0231531.1 cellulose biosynthesis protein BcsQ [Undibacterium sp. 10I3]MEB0255832.1 cellulose biosynthesis protein BcsQ [Undibacterium sp. 5I1]
MIVIAIVSAKGGVGKTTTTANLSAGIAQRDYPSLVIDLDPQNAVQWHMGGGDQSDTSGISTIANRATSRLWDAAYSSTFGVDFVPYGSAGEQQRIAFEQVLEQDEDWLLNQLLRANLPKDTFVFLDTPPGPSIYLTQAINAADFLLVVLLADAASYATIPEMESLIDSHNARSTIFKPSAYVVNQGSKKQLAQDVIALFSERLGDRMLPCVIPESTQLEEALAYGYPILQSEPDSPAAQAVQELVVDLMQTLYEIQSRR